MCGCNKKVQPQPNSRPANITYTVQPNDRAAVLELASEKIAELEAFTPHLIPAQVPVDTVRQALLALAERLHALP